MARRKREPISKVKKNIIAELIKEYDNLSVRKEYDNSSNKRYYRGDLRL